MRFTERQKQILQLIAAGYCNKRIAKNLSISPHTVRDHVSAMLAQTACTNRVQLALLHIKPPPPTTQIAEAWWVLGPLKGQFCTPYICRVYFNHSVYKNATYDRKSLDKYQAQLQPRRHGFVGALGSCARAAAPS